jgi:hypothetical protein
MSSRACHGKTAHGLRSGGSAARTALPSRVQLNGRDIHSRARSACGKAMSALNEKSLSIWYSLKVWMQVFP